MSRPKGETVSPSATVRTRPGGRSERVRVAVMDAAVNQLAAHGYNALSIANVAREAGVAETTVYRRWPTPADLAGGAVAHLAQTDNPVPDTGTLEGDLHALLSQIIKLVERPEVERILRAAAALDGGNAMSAQARESFWQTRFTAAGRIVERAIERGELAPGTDVFAVIEHLVAPAYMRVLLTNRPLDDELLEGSVRRTLKAFDAAPAQNPA
ncbi:TetR/AcrR family transcriptional regulator [Streptomyces sp. enrichment culture]|uniref:TetR/AcrR family transcriptional regulator n=1 Tax=Streptomyces sp. enrichment culture TaxID=1795815 RepID=UPI003F578329